MKKKHIKFLSLLFIVFPMSIVMALVGVFRNFGFTENWYLLFLKSWTIMFPVAYCSALLFSPLAKKLTEMCENKNYK